MPRLLLVLLALLATPALAQPAGLAAGAALPEADRALATADGGQLALRQAAGPNGLVVVFWSNVCPWAERYGARLAALSSEYGPAGIGFAAVNANDAARFPEEGPDEMRRAAAEYGFGFPYLRDESGTLARAFGARATPQVFLFSSAGALVYDGAIDDSPSDPERVTLPYLRQAMDQQLAGLAVEVQRTAALGCTVKPSGDAP